MRQRHLAMRLSSLKSHPCHSVELEQYPTEGNLAAAWLTKIDLGDSFEGKHILDLGAGNGVLGIGAAFLGAKQVTMVECDKTALDIIDENIAEVEGNEFLKTIHHRVDGSAIELDSTVDIAIMNPPWGVQTKHADRAFFETLFAMNIPLIHFIHSIDAGHLAALAKSNGYAIHSIYQTDFRLPAVYSHHKQQQGSTRIRCYRLERLK